MKYILDTSAFLSGKDFPGNLELYTTQSVLDELKFQKMQRKIENLLSVSGLAVNVPSEASIDAVKKRAEETGDIARVSKTDIEILALAIDMINAAKGASTKNPLEDACVLITDDYSIQNLAKGLGVKYEPMALRGITKEIIWSYRCRGCKKFFDAPQKECPVCGSEVRTTRASRTKKQQ